MECLGTFRRNKAPRRFFWFGFRPIRLPSISRMVGLLLYVPLAESARTINEPWIGGGERPKCLGGATSLLRRSTISART